MKKTMLVVCLALLAGCAAKEKPLSELTNHEVCYRTGEDKAKSKEDAVKLDIKEIVSRKLTKADCAPFIASGYKSVNRSVAKVNE